MEGDIARAVGGMVLAAAGIAMGVAAVAGIIEALMGRRKL